LSLEGTPSRVLGHLVQLKPIRNRVVRSAQTIKDWEQVLGSFAHQVLTAGIVFYDRQKQPV
jgi:hypothetical protein